MVLSASTSSLIAVLFGNLTQLGFYDQQPWIVIAAPFALVFIAVLNGGSMFMSNYLLWIGDSDLLKPRFPSN